MIMIFFELKISNESSAVRKLYFIITKPRDALITFADYQNETFSMDHEVFV